MLFFAYGTLKRGESRHRYLAGQKYVGTARTRAQYRLFDLGDYPGLVERPNGRSIEGEVWEVTPECLARLDIVEGCHEGLYRRAEIALLSPYDQLPVVTYFYEKTVDGMPDCGGCW